MLGHMSFTTTHVICKRREREQLNGNEQQKKLDRLSAPAAWITSPNVAVMPTLLTRSVMKLRL